MNHPDVDRHAALPRTRTATRRALIAGAAALFAAGAAGFLGEDAAARRRRVRNRRRNRNQNRSNETSISIPGKPGEPGEDGEP